MSGRFQAKPPVSARINWSHPLSRGLVSAFVLNEGAGSCVSSVPGVGSINVSTWVHNQTGTATKHQVVGEDIYPNLEFTGSDKEFTIVGIAVPAATSDYQEICGYGSYWNGNNGGFCFGFLPGGTTIYCLHQDNNLVAEDANDAATTSANVGWTAGRVYHLACSFKLGVASKLYVNGSLVSTNTSVGSTINYLSPSAKGIVIADHPDVEVSLALIYNRALSAAEIQQLYVEPYCFLERTPNWSRFVSSASNVFTSTLTATASAFSASTNRATSKRTTASASAMSGTTAKATSRFTSASTASFSASTAKATSKGLVASASSFAGYVVKTTDKLLSAASASVAAVISKSTGKVLSATASTAAGTITKATNHTETAQASSFTATTTKATNKPLTASTTSFTASVVRTVGKHITAAIDSFTASLTGYRLGLVIEQAFTAALSAMSATASKLTSHSEMASMNSLTGQATRTTAKRLQAASEALIGTVSKAISRNLNAVMAGFTAVLDWVIGQISGPQRNRVMRVAAGERSMVVARERRVMTVDRLDRTLLVPPQKRKSKPNDDRTFIVPAGDE